VSASPLRSQAGNSYQQLLFTSRDTINSAC
jgi:hypothetical protein